MLRPALGAARYHGSFAIRGRRRSVCSKYMPRSGRGNGSGVMRPEHNAQLQDRLLSVGVPAVVAGWLSVSGLRSTAGRSSRLGNTDARSSPPRTCNELDLKHHTIHPPIPSFIIPTSIIPGLPRLSSVTRTTLSFLTLLYIPHPLTSQRSIT